MQDGITTFLNVYGERKFSRHLFIYLFVIIVFFKDAVSLHFFLFVEISCWKCYAERNKHFLLTFTVREAGFQNTCF